MRALILFLFASLLGGWFTAAAMELPAAISISEGPLNAIEISQNGAILAINHGNSNDIDTVLLTHARRDVVLAAEQTGGSLHASESSREFLEEAEKFWEEFWEKRYDYYGQQVTRIPVRNFPADQYLSNGTSFDWEGLQFSVIETPGYTRDGTSYLVEIDGIRIAFVGDLLLHGGKVPDIYSFQEAIPDAKVGAYHGYMGRLSLWIDSLNTLQQTAPDFLVPSRGKVIKDPQVAIEKAISKSRKIYRNYLITNALHWYFGEERMGICAAAVLGPDHGIEGMPFAEHIDLPDWCHHIGTTKLLVSDSKRGFVLDVGGQKQLDGLLQIVEDNLVRRIDGVFATHTHNDHTQKIADAIRNFYCPVYATSEVGDVLLKPGAWFLPGTSANRVSAVTPVADGEKKSWRGFEFTFHHFPGQMYNHGALLVEKENQDPVFFIGDSFSPSGIDDYCLMNRNLMREDTGYLYCFKVIRELPPSTWLVNQHIPHLFRFSSEELDFLEGKYRERIEFIKTLTPWDDLNFAIDERWATFYPFGQGLAASETSEMALRIWNHSTTERRYEVKAYCPSLSFTSTRAVRIGSREEGRLSFEISIPERAEPGLHVVLADISRDDGVECHAWCEALIKVE